MIEDSFVRDQMIEDSFFGVTKKGGARSRWGVAPPFLVTPMIEESFVRDQMIEDSFWKWIGKQCGELPGNLKGGVDPPAGPPPPFSVRRQSASWK